MNVYFDLSMILLFVLSLVCLYFSEVLMIVKLKMKKKMIICLINSFFIFFIYLPQVISFFLIVIINYGLFYLLFKEKRRNIFLLYIGCYFLLSGLESLFSKDLSYKHFIVIISNPNGILYALITPLFGFCLMLASRFVDTVYRLGNYKMEAIIIKNKNKAVYSCYFDSGNTLKYDNVPVIFCLKNKWILDCDETKEIEVETINGKSTSYGIKALIEMEDSKDAYFVYVVLVDNVDSFHGCEMLLNAYLS